MRIRAAVAVLVISGLAWIGMPSAAADELPPTPAETSSVTAPAEEPVTEPTPEPSDVPTGEVTAAEPEQTPRGEPAEPTGGDTADPADGVIGELTEAPDETQAAEMIDVPPAAEEGEATGPTDSAAPTIAPAAARVEGERLSSQAVAEPVLDPRGSIGDLNCADLTIPVTVDNARSTGAVGFRVGVSEGEENFFSEEVEVAAGASAVIRVLVTDGSFVRISASVFDPTNENLSRAVAISSLKVICSGDEPRANVGDVNCSTLTVPVTLDNSRSQSETSFRVWIVRFFEDEGRSSQETFAVPAGEARTIPIDATRVDALDVQVGLTGVFAWLAQEEMRMVDCGPSQGVTTVTTATIGDPDCRTRTFPVTIDNSDVVEPRTVEVNADWSPPSVSIYVEYVFVGPGEMRVVRVPIPRSIHGMDVIVVSFEAQTTLDDRVLAQRVMHMNCPSTAARPTFAVRGAKFPQASGVSQLPQTGGFRFALPLLGVALLAGGGGMLALSGRRPGRVIGGA